MTILVNFTKKGRKNQRMSDERINKIMEAVCEVCRWPFECRNKDHLAEICDNCPVLAELNDPSDD